jgi:hypothetical protein
MNGLALCDRIHEVAGVVDIATGSCYSLASGTLPLSLVLRGRKGVRMALRLRATLRSFSGGRKRLPGEAFLVPVVANRLAYAD